MGAERLIYLINVTEKMSFADYFYDPTYSLKVPDLSHSKEIYRVGDNIYQPSSLDPSGFERVKSRFHNEPGQKEHDLSGRYVLASNYFFYFGKHAIEIPRNLRPAIPRGQSGHGCRTHDEALSRRFIEYVAGSSNVGVHGPPHFWPPGDDSWRDEIDI